MGGHKSSTAPVRPLPRAAEGPRDKGNGYILPGPCLQGCRHPPPCVPQSHHGQTSPLSTFSLQTNLRSLKNKAECLAMVRVAHGYPHPPCQSFPAPEQQGSWNKRTLHLVKPEEKLLGRSRGEGLASPTPRGHSWGNKLAISIAHLPAAQPGSKSPLHPMTPQGQAPQRPFPGPGSAPGPPARGAPPLGSHLHTHPGPPWAADSPHFGHGSQRRLACTRTPDCGCEAGRGVHWHRGIGPRHLQAPAPR